jgi:hypothetical protein
MHSTVIDIQVAGMMCEHRIRSVLRDEFLDRPDDVEQRSRVQSIVRKVSKTHGCSAQDFACLLRGGSAESKIIWRGSAGRDAVSKKRHVN